jgi:hypothetical protein
VTEREGETMIGIVKSKPQELAEPGKWEAIAQDIFEMVDGTRLMLQHDDDDNSATIAWMEGGKRPDDTGNTWLMVENLEVLETVVRGADYAAFVAHAKALLRKAETEPAA